ncbi:MAG: diterpene synthase [Anaerolineae bacterium]|nr:diterpene synthase [Anaerolineae bacterium]
MDRAEFQDLPTEQVGQLVRAAGPKVCVFPINGTRRWFLLTHPSQRGEGLASAYLDATAKRHVEIYRLLFDHGLDTLLTPVFGPDLVERGEPYVQTAADGLARLATHPDFLDFYDTYDVRVRFYGDHRRFLGPTPYAYLSDLFDGVTARTLAHGRHRLFFGLFAHDATEALAEIAIRWYQEQGCPPDKRQIVEAYYGEYVGPVDLFIGFDMLSAFDMPLVATGTEDLYFTVSPSLYLTQRQLRDILYDHLYARRGEPDYSDMSAREWDLMGDFYQANMERTLGVGMERGGVWYPLPQARLPPGFA